MARQVIVLALACVLIVFGNIRSGPTAEELTTSLIKATEPAEVCLRPDLDTDELQAQRNAPQQYGTLPYPADWPGKNVIGGDVPAVRHVMDPAPDLRRHRDRSENGVVAMSDENRGSLLVYDHEKRRPVGRRDRPEAAHHRTAGRPRAISPA